MDCTVQSSDIAWHNVAPSVRAYNLVPFPIAMVILCLVPFIACLGGIPTPVIRAMMSNVVDPDEQGGEYLMCS